MINKTVKIIISTITYFDECNGQQIWILRNALVIHSKQNTFKTSLLRSYFCDILLSFEKPLNKKRLNIAFD